ncbi:hypothetical protein [Nocardioides ferulae]|uniref:hypothetical protein n=1 Tax=Nocardioides ferulae TaxID=2340821 RepID=UPI000EAF7CB3|nr:hypothetical protein [Nocardioides ferulae]
MNHGYVELSSGRLMQGLRDHKRLLAVCVLLGVALAGVRLLLGGTSYAAQSQVLVGQPLTLTTLTTTAATGVDQTRLVDYTQRRLASDKLAARVEKRLDVDGDDYTLDIISANATNVIGLQVTSDDPERAQTIANGFARAYVASVVAENTRKVDRAVEQLQSDIKTVDAQLTGLQQQAGPAGAVVAASQRAALVQQRVTLANRLSQARLAGAVDPAGGAQVVEQAAAGETSRLALVAPLVLGGLFGFLVGLGLVALRQWRTARSPQPATEGRASEVSGARLSGAA